jgi:NTE family protein
LTASTLEAWVRSRARPPRAMAVDGFPAGITPIAGPDAASIRFGVLSLSARTAREAKFVDVIRQAIRPAEDWPDVLRVTTVDAYRGIAVAIDGRAGVPLHRAIAASSSVPVLFPPVRFLGRKWIDGGMVSTTHVPLAASCEEVLVIAPLPARTQDEEIAQVRAAGVRVDVIMPSPEALLAVGGGLSLLDPRRRPLAARAGLEDGRRAAAMLLARRMEPESAPKEADSAA